MEIPPEAPSSGPKRKGGRPRKADPPRVRYEELDHLLVYGELIEEDEAKERWATDFKILLQRQDVHLPQRRELVGQIHAIKRRVLPSGKVSFDAERTSKGHADKFWAVALACQKERAAPKARSVDVGVRVIG